jgi:hypothetical protein
MTEENPATTPPPAPARSGSPRKSSGIAVKISLINLGLLVLLAGGIYLWKEWSVQKVQNESAQREEAVITQSQLELSKRTEGFLQLTAVPFVWAIRSEMLRENMEQVDGYTRSFVKQPGVEFVAVANAAGKIVVATDKKWEGQPITGLISEQVVSASFVQVIKGEGAEAYQVVAPVMGYNARLGTVLLTFSAGAIEVQSGSSEIDPHVSHKE